MLIEPVAAYDDAVLREVGVFWPRRFDGMTTVCQPDALHEVSTNLCGIDLDVGEFGNGTRRQHVAARLVARTAAFLDDSDVMPGASQPCGDA